jgi:hypothetical protein
MFENVTNATNGVDQGPWRVVVYLIAQTINMDIHHVGCGIDPHSPNVIQDHGASYYAPFIAAKVFQQGKLLWGQLQ